VALITIHDYPLLDGWIMIPCMEKLTNEEMEAYCSKYATLPDGQEVIVEEVRSDGSAYVRRVGGERAGTAAICKVDDLQFL